jgi:threonine/homoserine/homoserine lactone efflux protein
MTSPLLFCIAVLTILATPGPTNTLLAISGASAGLRRSWILVAAELAGYVTAILIVGLVVGPFLSRPGPFVVIRVAITLYLAYLSIRLWRLPPPDLKTARSVGPRDVLVTTLLNPKASIFALAIIPMQNPSWPLYLLGFCVMLLPMSLLWIGIGSAMRRGMLTRSGTSLVHRVGATVIMLFAAVVFWTVAAAAWA